MLQITIVLYFTYLFLRLSGPSNLPFDGWPSGPSNLLYGIQSAKCGQVGRRICYTEGEREAFPSAAGSLPERLGKASRSVAGSLPEALREAFQSAAGSLPEGQNRVAKWSVK